MQGLKFIKIIVLALEFYYSSTPALLQKANEDVMVIKIKSTFWVYVELPKMFRRIFSSYFKPSITLVFQHVKA